MDDYQLYVNKGSNSSDSEFNLQSMIDAFSFDNLFYDVPNDGTDLAGCVVITEKQEFASYSMDHGRGVHNGLYARVMKELYGGGEISSFQEALRLAGELHMNYIVARINFCATVNDFGRITSRNGILAFVLKDRTITPEEYDMFLKFYDENNEAIKMLSSKAEFRVTFPSFEIGPDGKKFHVMHSSGSLDELKSYLETRISTLDNGTTKIPNEVIQTGHGLK